MREKSVSNRKIASALLITCSVLLMGLATPQMIYGAHSQLTKDGSYSEHLDESMVITASQIQGDCQDADEETLGALGGLSVTKKIWDGCNWVDTLEASMGDILTFNITIVYTKICGNVATNVNVTDILPHCLSYISGSGVITHGTNVYTGESSISGQQIKWYLQETYGILLYSEDMSPSTPPHYATIYFDAEVTDCTSECGEHNQVYVDALEHCCGEPMWGSDEATIIVPCEGPAVLLDKKVKDDCTWVDIVTATVGDDIEFKLTVTNTGTVVLHNVNVTDDLPSYLTYNYDASIAPSSATDHHIEWTLGTLAVGSHKEILFSAHADSAGEGKNVAEVDTHEGVSDFDAVRVIVDLGPPDVEIIKKVKDGSIWGDTTTASVGDDIEFKLLITNTGSIDLTAVHVVDTLPAFLVYNDDANITPLPISTDHHLEWDLGTLLVGEKKEITFSAHACAAGEGDNVASVTTCQSVHDEDSVHVFVAGMTVVKDVWDDALHMWRDEVDASVGETVRFRITISYIGDGTYDLYNIEVLDILPECLCYADNACPSQTHISGDGRTIWWNLTTHLSAGQSMVISFDALVTETSGCGPCVNWARVTANECSGAIYCEEDDATVHAECPLIADAGGPYFGEIDTSLTLSGSALGGTPPYSYKWDLDDNGYYDATGKTITRTWHTTGTYVISLKVTDDDGRWDIDDTTVTIAPSNNQVPTKPSQPSGPTTGTTGTAYIYSTSSTDPDGDTLRYGWDWNGDSTVDTWTGYYASGQTISQSHTWTTSGTYTVKVKAQDENGGESGFSTALSVSISGNAAPSQPSVTGPSSGKIGMSHTYTASASDPNGDQVYYWFDWDDGANTGWLGPYASGQSASASHVWSTQGSYSIKVKCKDSHGEESTWTTLTVTMPKYRFSGFDGLLRLFEDYPLLYRILQEFFLRGIYS
jgi:uncharacterized repeat protein (TIGR01451 family)